LGQINKGELGSITASAEHTFTAEDRSQVYSVQAAYQIIIFPNFDRFCDSHIVQPYVGFPHPRGYPGALLPFADTGGTGRYHLLEPGIPGNPELTGIDYLPHAPGNFDSIGKKDHPWIGTPP